MNTLSKIARSKAGLAAGAALLVAVGVAGGASAVAMTRPSVEMAPTVATPIAKLPSSGDGVVTVKGRVAEAYGDRIVVQDNSGRAMVAVGRDGRGTVAVGQPVTVQGRFDDGQLRASYLVDGNGRVEAVGPRGHGERGPHGRGPDDRGPDGRGPGGPGGRGPDGPPPPPGGCAVPPPPGGQGAPVPPPPGAPAPVAGAGVTPAAVPAAADAARR